jgi:hypothetical protein
MATHGNEYVPNLPLPSQSLTWYRSRTASAAGVEKLIPYCDAVKRDHAAPLPGGLVDFSGTTISIKKPLHSYEN